MYGYNGYGQPQYGNAVYQPHQVGMNYQQIQQNNGNMNNMQYINNMQVLKGRPVANFEEANAAMIDLDGTMFVFPDIANKRIYTKQIMLDGKPQINIYTLTEQGQVQPEQTQEIQQKKQEYVLLSDYNKTVKRLESKINKFLKGGKISESDADGNTNDDE